MKRAPVPIPLECYGAGIAKGEVQLNDGQPNGFNVGIGTASPDFPWQVNGSTVPETTGQDLGDAGAGLYWDLLSSDITFMNGFKLTEDGDDALAIHNPDGIKVVRIDKDGNLFIKGELKKLE